MTTPPIAPVELSRICVLTVTYGDRVDLLQTMIQSAAEQGIKRVLVFGNGLSAPVRAKLDQMVAFFSKTFDLTTVVSHADQNLGPAEAYARLIAGATADIDQTDAILLLDDDNRLAPGCLSALCTAHAHGQGGALCAVRSDRHYMVRAAKTGRFEAPLNGEAFGTDLRKKPRRLWARLTKKPVTGDHEPGLTVPISLAPYGGMFIPRAMLTRVAPPRSDFVIYADDYEYAERLAENGGLSLVPGAVVDDQEQSWNATPENARPQTAAVRLATAKPDFRIYYALRNALFLDRRRLSLWGTLWFLPNLIWLLLWTASHAVIRGRWSNLSVVACASRDGLSGRLGLHPKFPLP